MERVPKRLSKSIAILARKKSGKTAIVQRIFNQLWTQNGQIIPFYYEIQDRKTWFPNFAIDYFCSFASQCISFLERDPQWIRIPLSLEKIQDYGKKHNLELFVQGVDELQKYKKEGDHDLMWEVAHNAPHRFAGAYDRRVVVMLDEFQNIAHYIYRDQACQDARDESLAGSYHEHSESKIAPMLVTGSYVGWLVNVINQYLEAGRLRFYQLSPYLAEEEGLQAVLKYSEFYEEPVTTETAMIINQLCFSDPFFISCIILSHYEKKDLTTTEGVVATIHYEISNRKAELARTWADYIDLSVGRINNRNAKKILLHLSKYPGEDWTHHKLKEKLGLDLSLDEILKELERLTAADLLQEGSSDIAFQGLDDGSLNLILRNRFEEEISQTPVDLKQDFLQEIEKLNKRL